jgi:MOSC domain-containing protein YiiM
MTRPGIIKDLVHRAGINADVLRDGVIRVGDEVTTLS